MRKYGGNSSQPDSFCSYYVKKLALLMVLNDKLLTLMSPRPRQLIKTSKAGEGLTQETLREAY